MAKGKRQRPIIEIEGRNHKIIMSGHDTPGYRIIQHYTIFLNGNAIYANSACPITRTSTEDPYRLALRETSIFKDDKLGERQYKTIKRGQYDLQETTYQFYQRAQKNLKKRARAKAIQEKHFSTPILKDLTTKID